MKYLQKSFSLAMGKTGPGKPRAGTKTFVYCEKCEKVHEREQHVKKIASK